MFPARKILPLFLFLSLAHCAKETATPVTPTSPADLSGTWKSQCFSDSTGPFRVVVVFSGDQFKSSTESYSSAKCDDATFRTNLDTSGKFEVTGNDERSGAVAGAQKLTWTYDGKTLFDIVVYDRLSLRFGDADGQTNSAETRRPLKLSDSIYTRE